MFKNVLVPLDGTPEAVTALPLARVIVAATGGHLTLLRAIPSWESSDSPVHLRASRYLTSVATNIGGNRADTIVVNVPHGGDVVAAIVNAACTSASDLIVMSAHARDSGEQISRTGVAGGVLAQCRVPVILLAPDKRSGTRPKMILVPVDGTPAGEAALEAAGALARACGAGLFLLRVVVPVPSQEDDLFYADDAGRTVPLVFDREALDEAECYVETLARRLQYLGVEIQGRALFSGASDAILECATRIDADLIAMSTHARVGMARAVLGSVADTVMRQANLPVLLVHREARTAGKRAGRQEARVHAIG